MGFGHHLATGRSRRLVWGLHILGRIRSPPGAGVLPGESGTIVRHRAWNGCDQQGGLDPHMRQLNKLVKTRKL